MKIKKLGLLTALSSVAVIGLGSATWVFTKTADVSYESVGTVASFETVGEVTLAASPKFTFTIDKTSLTFDIDITPTYTATGVSDSDISSSVTFTYDISFATAYYTYFSFANITGIAWTNKTQITSVPTTTKATWITDKNPTTKSAYDTMKTALTDATTGKITVTFKATSTNV